LFRYFQHLAFFILVMLIAGCQQETGDPVINFGLQSAPLNLDPRMATDASAERINRLIYRPLVDVDEKLESVPGLADWQVLSARHYRFTLKQDIQPFHNGQQLTSRDVVACYQYILNTKNASPHQGNLAHIEKITVVDNSTIDFHLSRNDVLFPGRLSIGIPSKDTNLVGNGSFRIVNAEMMSNIELERLRDGQRVVFKHVQDATVRVLKLLRGELDIIQNDLQAELVDYLGNKDEITVQFHQGSTFSYIGFNMDDPLMSDPLLRKAIALAIDRSKLITALLGDRAILSHSVLPLQHWARLEKMRPFSYQPEKARQILRQAGYADNKRPQVIYKTTTDALRLRIAAVIQKQLSDVGIDMEIRSYDWGTFYADIKSGNFQMYSLSWVGINSPDIYQTIFHSNSVPPKGANRGRYSNPDIDQLLDNAFTGAAPRQALPKTIDKVQSILLKDLPYIPLWFENHVAATTQRVKHYSLSLNGSYDALASVTLE